MGLGTLTLSDVIKKIGKANIYVGDPFKAGGGGMLLLGATEGEITVDEAFQYNDLKAPEYTGDMIHERQVDGQSIAVTVPLIMGDEALFDTLSPLGAKGGGYSEPQDVVTTAVLVIAQSEVKAHALACVDGVWAGTPPVPPKVAFWIWKATPEPGPFKFKHADGGKVIRDVTFRGMFFDTNPEGQKLYSIGDPADQGVDGLNI